MVQAAILVLGALAIWLVGRREKWSRWGYVVGMISQPFWIHTSYYNEQWGILALSVWYTYAWGQGIYNFWYLPSTEIVEVT